MADSINTPNPSAIPQSPSRRSIIAAGAAAIGATAVAAPVAAMAGASDVDALIDAHRLALAEFEKVSPELDAAQSAWEAERVEGFDIPSFLGGGYSSRNGHNECRRHIAAGYENKRRGLVLIELIAPDLAAQTREVLDKKEAENLELVDKLFAEEEERRQAFGLAAVEERYDAASSAETDAAVALCSYRCKTADEEKRRALYLLGSRRLGISWTTTRDFWRCCSGHGPIGRCSHEWRNSAISHNENCALPARRHRLGRGSCP